MSASSYAFAVGNIRAREGSLLKKQDIEQMLAKSKVSDLTAFLRDKGFGTAEQSSDINMLLAAEESKLWKYAESIAPDFSVFDAFIIGNDYHNVKAVFKGTLKGTDYKGLLLTPTTFDPDLITKAVAEKSFGLLPEFLSEAAEKAFDALFKVGDPQLCDAILDASYNENRLKMAEKLRLSMLSEMICATVFFDNAKAAIRCARAKKSADFMEACLVDTKPLSKAALKSAALKGTDELLGLLSTVSVYRGAEAVDAYKKAPAEFERFADNFIMSVAAKAKYVAVGAEPLIAYLQARLTEIKVCRIIANGIATGEEGEKTREMLRELYG